MSVSVDRVGGLEFLFDLCRRIVSFVIGRLRLGVGGSSALYRE